MKKFILFANFILASVVLQAQFTSPGTGVYWNLDSLVSNSGGAVTGADGAYTIHEDITIAAEDTLDIVEDVEVQIAPEVLVTVFGAFFSQPELSAVYTVSEDEHYAGFRFEEFSEIVISRSTFEYGGGLRVLTENFILDNCVIQYNEANASTGGAIGLSRGKPLISNSHFLENESAAISSGANIECAPIIEFCVFESNNTGNSNRPQINLGPSGVDTTFIRNNEVIGDPENTQVGGIAFTSFLAVEGHAVIEGNLIENNRYGIAIDGSNITTRIEGNTTINNNTQGEPMSGGSGLTFSGDNYNYISGNFIRGNLWGITILGNAIVNLGDTATENYNPGGNQFNDNGNNGVTYALYNNTTNEVMAMNNCWDEDSLLVAEDIEDVIFHQVDDSELGLVHFSPFDCISVGIDEKQNDELIGKLYPNPVKNQLSIHTNTPAERLRVYDLTGKEVISKDVSDDGFQLTINVDQLSPGIYILKIENEKVFAVKKFIKQ